MDYNLNNIPSREYFPGFHGKMIHMQHMTLAFWDVEQDAEVPAHSHHHEQVMHVIKGRFEFTLEDITAEYEAGDIVVIPPNASHSGKALTKCALMDVFCPVREDYKL